jgi:hypothetical protein
MREAVREGEEGAMRTEGRSGTPERRKYERPEGEGARRDVDSCWKERGVKRSRGTLSAELLQGERETTRILQ